MGKGKFAREQRDYQKMKQVTQMFTQIYSQLDTNPSLPKQTGLFSLQDREPFAVKLRVVMLWPTVLICSFLLLKRGLFSIIIFLTLICISCQANTDDIAPHTSRTENVVKECIDLNAAIDDNSPFACENGSASDPYRISHEVELWYLGRQNITEITAKNWYEKHFRIIFKIDMDLLATEWNLPGFRPIGSCGLNDICNDADDVPFTGYFTGRDSSGIVHEIHGLSLNLTGEDGVGLFGRTGTNAELHYMHLKRATVEGQQRSGILVGHASDTLINNSFVAGSLEGTDKVGGLVGEMSTSEIRASYSTATITATTTSMTEAYAGGLVGYVDTNGSINHSYAIGLVTSTATQDAYGGGLVGKVNSGQVNQSYAMGGADVTSTGPTK